MQFRGMWLLTAVIMASRLLVYILVIMMAVAFLDSILSSSIKATFQ